MSDDAPNPRRTPSEVARACLDAHTAENWPKLRTLLHPDALIATFAGGGRPENPERALTRLRDVHRDFVYHADVAQMVELDDQAILSVVACSTEMHATAWSMSSAGGCTSSVTDSSTAAPCTNRTMKHEPNTGVTGRPSASPDSCSGGGPNPMAARCAYQEARSGERTHLSCRFSPFDVEGGRPGNPQGVPPRRLVCRCTRSIWASSAFQVSSRRSSWDSRWSRP